MINHHKEIRRTQHWGLCQCGKCYPPWSKKDAVGLYRSTRRILKQRDKKIFQSDQWDNY